MLFISMEKKFCSRCKLEQELTNFTYKCKPKKILKPHCKECDRKSRKEYYSINRERIIGNIIQRNKAIKKNNLIFIMSYFSENPCVDCGETNPIVLEFDHRDREEKKYNISEMLNHGSSVESIKEEIKKCDVRCANCHKIRTAKQFNWYNCLNN